ncbi:SET and MYND domain-containing protein 4-like isoform X2 [Topomyia yanbarensis]|uniref:SET and MYND domain-containing protein 4-like isoform X2 n=1 Tax=Topomyia yanbarensis TaxID=2498891 RepID=UPI00273B4146|nr:SET and MYND domain-containing protein 4-like isoform X2 [Topomyia yanbarensis]XP_058819601.1 SET and MYND domain-containing protein 4-like isoform X2 [Topomyia yanbarensis]
MLLGFANNIDIIGFDRSAVEEAYVPFKRETARIGLVINLAKTKYMITGKERGLEKSIVLANRSAALFHLNKFEEALKDIDLSIYLYYPNSMQYKLMERKARCYIALKDLPAALDFYRETCTALGDSNLCPEMQKEMIIATKKKVEDLEVYIATVKRYLEPVKHSLTKKFVAHVDKSVFIDCTENEGRFARTRADLKPNQLVLKELPHASVVMSECSSTHCDHCCLRVEVLFCCSRCVDVVFCSQRCQDAACSSYHRFECGFLPYLRSSGANVVCMLALRIVTQKSLGYFYGLKDELEQLASEHTDRLPAHDYRRVYKFVTHSEQRSPEDYLKWTVMAAFLNTISQLGGFYKREKLDELLGTILLHNMQIVTYNSHEVSELLRRKESDPGYSICIGAALYPTLVLFNHSCDPGITRYFVGNAVFVRTIKNIPAGSVVAENYGQLFARSDRRERRNTLKSIYKFDCNCQACDENWPTFYEMSPNMVRFKCAGRESCNNALIFTANSPQNSFRCEKCGEFTDIDSCFTSLKNIDMLNRFNEATSLYQHGEYDKALSKYAAIMTSLDQVLVKPYREYHLCQQGIRRCSLELGNKYTERK